jgi:hypothetical protein
MSPKNMVPQAHLGTYIQIHLVFQFLPWACLIVLLKKAEREHWQNILPMLEHQPDRIQNRNISLIPQF